MHNPIKNKRGIELAFGIIIGIVILLLSVVVIVWVIKSSASKADEKTQVELCRVSNEINIGMKERTMISTPRFCNTIDKTRGKSKVPSKLYPQDKKGAEAEIREMIKNCWYIWLEGSEPNMFQNLPGDEDCFVCYKFRIKDKVDDVEFMSLAESMTEPFFAEDASDKCSPVGGFLIPCDEACVGEEAPAACSDKCNAKFGAVTSCEDIHIRQDNSDEWKDIPSEKATAKGGNVKCCISKNAANECENKGGMCSEEGPSGDYKKIYYKWYCPKAKQRCYVKEEHMFSYLKYITEYGANGGAIYFAYYGEEEQDASAIHYHPAQEYVITFFSFGKEECDNSGGFFGFVQKGICKAVKWVGFDPSRSLVAKFISLIPGTGTEMSLEYGNALDPFLGPSKPNFMVISKSDGSLQSACKGG